MNKACKFLAIMVGLIQALFASAEIKIADSVDFAKEICGQFYSPNGSKYVGEIDANLEANIDGVIRKYVGGVNGKTALKRRVIEWASIPPEKLEKADQHVRECRKEMAKLYLDEQSKEDKRGEERKENISYPQGTIIPIALDSRQLMVKATEAEWSGLVWDQQRKFLLLLSQRPGHYLSSPGVFRISHESIEKSIACRDVPISQPELLSIRSNTGSFDDLMSDVENGIKKQIELTTKSNSKVDVEGFEAIAVNGDNIYLAIEFSVATAGGVVDGCYRDIKNKDKGIFWGGAILTAKFDSNYKAIIADQNSLKVINWKKNSSSGVKQEAISSIWPSQIEDMGIESLAWSQNQLIVISEASSKNGNAPRFGKFKTGIDGKLDSWTVISGELLPYRITDLTPSVSIDGLGLRFWALQYYWNGEETCMGAPSMCESISAEKADLIGCNRNSKYNFQRVVGLALTKNGIRLSGQATTVSDTNTTSNNLEGIVDFDNIGWVLSADKWTKAPIFFLAGPGEQGKGVDLSKIRSKYHCE